LEEAGRLAIAQLARPARPRSLAGHEDAPVVEASRPGAPVGANATVVPPRPEVGDGILRYSRTHLPKQAGGGLDRVHRMLRFEDPFLSSDPRRPEARGGLIEQLNQAGREVLGGSDLHFVPTSGDGRLKDDAFVDAALAQQARSNPDLIYYCPDTSRALGTGATPQQGQVRSLVLACVTSLAGELVGLLEVSSAEKDPFGIDDLAIVVLLADYCAGVLDRAARIEKLVFVDPMTLAYNRSYFDLQLQNEMARAQREESSMALCIADIDNFKSFNTSFGYEAGNQVLVQVAQSLKRGVRPFDTIARWGGEEFAVLLTSPVQAQDVVTISERLRSLVERQRVWIRDLEGQSHRVTVTVSIGVSLFPDHEKSASDLWSAANHALLEAKCPPKNQVVFYRPGPGRGDRTSPR
jgi:diguanylate cyclase (GGDEF)-like protein